MNKPNFPVFFAACAMGMIILDTKTVLSGAQEGILLCLQTIIPALFPFIILSGIITTGLLGRKWKLLSPVGRLCHIPKGAESLFMLGFLGGYPVGAQAISQAYVNGSLSKNAARRMLGFCSNAGPAFLFGMFSVVFSSPAIPWMLWLIHIISGLSVGFLLPADSATVCDIKKGKPMTVHKSLTNAIKNMSVICGWVIVFRIIITVCNKWFLWMLPIEVQVAFSGLLELSNGCIMLLKLPSEATRFLYASIFLAFGGLCVGMQTKSVTEDLGCGYYFPGKVLQTLFALLLSLVIQPLIFKSIKIKISLLIFLLIIIGVYLSVLYRKKWWHLRKVCSIIPVKISRKEQLYAVSKENNSFLQLLPARHRRK